MRRGGGEKGEVGYLRIGERTTKKEKGKRVRGVW